MHSELTSQHNHLDYPEAVSRREGNSSLQTSDTNHAGMGAFGGLQESLDEVTIKDTLEGDNMYTCSQCGKKVRAEKRSVLLGNKEMHIMIQLKVDSQFDWGL